MRPVVGLHTSATLPEWKGDCPRYTPISERGYHFGGTAPSEFWSLAYCKQFGMNSLWTDLTGISSTLTICKIHPDVLPLWSICKLFNLSEIHFIANVQNILSIICGHILVPWSSIFLAPVFIIIFFFFNIPFWWSSPTPQKVIFWYFWLMESMKPFSENLPFSAL